MDKQSDELDASNRWRTLRGWPVWVCLAGMVAARWVPLFIEDGHPMLWALPAFGPFLFGLLLLFWWLTFSRARWFERLIGFLGVVIGLVVTGIALDPSMRGPAMTVMTIPLGLAAFGIALLLFGRQLSARRTWVAVIAAFILFLTSALFKTDGVWGNFALDLDWRWSPTAEDKFFEQRNTLASLGKGDSASLTPAEMASSLERPEWPGFRGKNRDGVQTGTRLQSDWKANPPVEKWRIAIGPAWSSFAVAGDLLFTQEQRATDEAVVCYHADNGREIWSRTISSRFFDELGGLGPRATPTIFGDSIYAMGATGWVMCFDGVTGEIKWQQDLRKVADREPPMWGFSSSPYVDEQFVVVYAGGSSDNGIIAFDRATGEKKWTAPCGPQSYGSVQALQVAGNEYLGLLNEQGLHLFDPQSGAVKLNYSWPHMGYRSLQPQLVGDDQILIPTGMGTGTRLIKITQRNGELEAAEVWTSRQLKSDFNDCVQLDGYLYGFDNKIFTCISLLDGKTQWKGGRYGKGQVLMIADSKMLLVQTETGEIVLLEATPTGFNELGTLDALHGKTWNHPVIVANHLYARNAEDAVCYELPVDQ